MTIMRTRRLSTACYGLCLVLGALGAGCIDNPDDAVLGDNEASTSSEIVLNVNASYAIVGVQSNKCVGVVNNSTSVQRIEIRTCAGIASQRFRPEPVGGGFFRLRNELSGLCMDVSEISLTAGAPVLQFACNTGLNQQWSFTDVAAATAERITVRHSGQVLDVTGQATADGTLLEQWPSNNGTNQQFRMIEAVPAFQ
jgi:polyhydroxybutyrate depolymerase